jgi:lipoprotein-anchoring transpeptidase ErfK/SrfK
MRAEGVAVAAVVFGLIGCRGERSGADRAGGAGPNKPAVPGKATAPTRSRVTPAPAEAATRDGSSRLRAPVPVSLDGTTRPLPVVAWAPGKPRVYARSQRAWVYERPERSSTRIGYLRTGASSPTSASPASKNGCPGGWYPVEPRGFLCAGEEATLDPDDPLVRATREYPPDPLRRLPYVYGTVRNPGPVYRRLPTHDELLEAEPDIMDRMERWLGAPGEIGASYGQDVWLGGTGQAPDPAQAWRSHLSDPLPDFLRDPKGPRGSAAGASVTLGMMEPRVGYSMLDTFLHEGRRYGLTAELELIPIDRLRPIHGSDFHGFLVGKEVHFPFVIVRHPNARFWRRSSAKGGLVDDGPAPYRSALQLSGKQDLVKGHLYYETEDHRWLSDQHASRFRPARRMPAWGQRGERWIDINLTQQSLMLYDGTEPVYATLISSGEAGLEDPEHTTATKRGIFRIHTKHLTATMSSDEVGEEFELRDVPYVQYFDKEGYALHGAYWHDRFGIPKSHGCINLSPEDARRIFYFTRPELPLGWHGVLLPLKGTVMFVHP